MTGWTSGLQERRVANRGEVDRAAHEREANGLALQEQAPELVRVEPVDARPQADVRRERSLRLEPDE